MDFLVIFEDEHLLVVNKPAGLNTHAPGPYAGEGLYDWLRHREPRWAVLAIIHRLDKETSGVIVFSKTPLANRSLTQQFTQRGVRKKYILLTDRPVPWKELTVTSSLIRVGEKYASRSSRLTGERAETRFRPIGAEEARTFTSTLDLKNGPHAGCYRAIEAEPLTGRTHQIRVHAADHGFPVLGDTLYGGTPAPRVYLHAAEITFNYPASGQKVTFRAPPDFASDPRLALRAAVIDPQATNAYRLIHGASDGWPGWYVERLGEYVLSQGEQPLNRQQHEELTRLATAVSARGACHEILTRQVRPANPASPQLVFGETAPERFHIRENGLQFELSFHEGYSVGLFLDQRDNRRRLLTGHIAAGFPLATRSSSSTPHGAGPEPPGAIDERPFEVLNTFAYTCGFSVCAAKAGARTTSLDLSRKYLDWGQRNFAFNQLDPAGHDFIHGDGFDWLRRLAKKGRRFDVILLDPPTFSQSKASGVFRVEKDYSRLLASALPLLRPGGVLFASTNAAAWPPEAFLSGIEQAVLAQKRSIRQRHYAPQPPDFPISRAEPAYLKTVWLRID